MVIGHATTVSMKDNLGGILIQRTSISSHVMMAELTLAFSVSVEMVSELISDLFLMLLLAYEAVF